MFVNNAFIKIPNEVFDNFRKCRLSTIQWQIAMMILRYTYGYNRDSCDLSLSFIQADISANKRSIQRELQMLIKSGILIEKQAPTSTKSRVFAFNSNVSEWTVQTPDKNTASTDVISVTSGDVKSVTSTGVKITTQDNTVPKTKTKDNIQTPLESPQGESTHIGEMIFGDKEKRTQSDKHDDKSFDAVSAIEQSGLSYMLKTKLKSWLEYKRERGEVYKPMGLSSLISQAEKKSKQYTDTEVIDLIDTCMSNGYKGIIFDRLGSQGGSWQKELPPIRQLQTYHTFEEVFGDDF